MLKIRFYFHFNHCRSVITRRMRGGHVKVKRRVREMWYCWKTSAAMKICEETGSVQRAEYKL